MNPNDELSTLLPAMLDGEMSDVEQARLADLLRDNPQAQQVYLDFCWTHALLRRELGVYGEVPFGAAGFSPPSEVYGNSQLNGEPPFPTLPTTHYPLPTSDFVGSWAFSYMVATVIVCVMLLGFWAYKITHYQHIAEAPSQSAPSEAMPEMVFVGRITGMVDVKWSDDLHYLPPPDFAHVPLGRKYELVSGLMQITYDSGAKVILQGPCTYEVESTAGGYLSLGKLTAKVVSGQRSVASAKPQVANQKSPSSFILHPSSLFSVRTPTAVVTDLGTEFGVEVSEKGTTTSHVFLGLVKVQTVGDSRNKEVVLRANESVRVVNKGPDDSRLVLADVTGDPPAFVRRLVRSPRVLDLLDVVAGGNGMGWRRERGIDSTSGMEDPVFTAYARDGGRRYWPVKWHKLIDGVFAPDGGAGPVQLDSAGHAFDGFPRTDGTVYGSIWARAADVKPDERSNDNAWWIYAMGRGEQFMPDGRGLLGINADTGITFDLEAIRRAHPGFVPDRFRAMAGLGDARRLTPSADGMADVWVFVDGRLKLKREQLRPQDGAIDVNVEIGPSDRFLTLVVTDGGNGSQCDWVVFGDPVLHTTVDAEQPMKEKPSK